MLNLQALIRRDMQKIAANITEEQGKTLADAEGDVLRGLQVSILIAKVIHIYLNSYNVSLSLFFFKKKLCTYNLKITVKERSLWVTFLSE